MLDEVAAIEQDSSPDPWAQGVLRDELAHPDRRYLAALLPAAEARVVGFAGWAELAGEAHVMNIAVRADQRRQGIGTVLLDALLGDVADAGVETVTLEVRSSNTAARALYRRAGFDEAGIRPGYYRDGEDAVILWRR